MCFVHVFCYFISTASFAIMTKSFLSFLGQTLSIRFNRLNDFRSPENCVLALLLSLSTFAILSAAKLHNGESIDVCSESMRLLRRMKSFRSIKMSHSMKEDWMQFDSLLNLRTELDFYWNLLVRQYALAPNTHKTESASILSTISPETIPWFL